MFCTKCGANNEDNNVFCKKCGAKLIKPINNSKINSAPSSQDVSPSSGVVQAAKAVNVKLIAGIAAALIVVVMVIGGLTNRNKAEDVNDDKVTEVMNVAETIQTTVATVDESNDAIGDIEESSKQLYSVTAEKISNDIASFQHFIVNGMYSVSDRFYFDKDLKLEDVMVMTSTNRSNVSFVDIYSSSPDIIVADSADIKHVDDFVTFCADPYSEIEHDIRKGFNSVSDCYYNVVVESSNIDGEYNYYDGEAEYIYIKIMFISDKFVNQSWTFKMVQSASNPIGWLIDDCWMENNNSYKLSNRDDSEWLKAYKHAYGNNSDEGNQFCFIGQSNTGVPYLAKAWGGLDYYNGSEVISLCYSQNIEYNPVTNKVHEYSHTSLPNGGGENFYLIDLNTGEVELSCAEVTEDWDTGIVKYYGDDGEVSEEEYTRISDEISKRFGDDGIMIETWYDSVDLAYRAYKINKSNESASDSVSDVNASESADTALAAGDSASEYILEDSNSRYLTKSDLQGLSADECRIARNEIYARYGRKFNDEELQSYFNSCSWYNGTIEPDDFQESMLNDYEIENKNLIVEYEKEMGYR